MEHNDMILNFNMVHLFEHTKDFCNALGYPEDFINELWEGIILHNDLYNEYIYYLNHHEFEGKFTFEGYGMFDLYFYELRHFNLRHDLGRNLSECDKDEIAILAFHTMGQFLKHPEEYRMKLEKGMGTDYL